MMSYLNGTVINSGGASTQGRLHFKYEENLPKRYDQTNFKNISSLFFLLKKPPGGSGA